MYANENTLGWSVVAFLACEIIQFFCSVLCVVRFVYKFAFRLFINETLNKRWPVFVKTTSWIDVHSRFWQYLYVFPEHCCEFQGSVPTVCRSGEFFWVRDFICFNSVLQKLLLYESLNRRQGGPLIESRHFGVEHSFPGQTSNEYFPLVHPVA
jgi:hypothetical protein